MKTIKTLIREVEKCVNKEKDSLQTNKRTPIISTLIGIREHLLPQIQNIKGGRIFNYAIKKILESVDCEKEYIPWDENMKQIAEHFSEPIIRALVGPDVDFSTAKYHPGLELIVVKRIADVIYTIKDKQGQSLLIQLEFESYKGNDDEFSKRMKDYRKLLSIKNDFHAASVHCNVIYLHKSPKIKSAIETITTNLKIDGENTEFEYQAYHVQNMTVKEILRENKLYFLLALKNKKELTPYLSEIKTIFETELSHEQEYVS